MLAWKDLGPDKRAGAGVTLGLIIVNVVVHMGMAVSGADPGAYGSTGAGLKVSSLFLSPFLHGGFLHLVGNMWFLWIFGRVVEPALGGGTFLFLYLFFGFFSGLCDILARLGSPIPAIGASGAIAGVMALCAVLYPSKRFAVFSWTQSNATLSAAALVGYYLFFDVFYGVMSLLGRPDGVAHFAHLGGAAAGILFGVLFKATGMVEASPEPMPALAGAPGSAPAGLRSGPLSSRSNVAPAPTASASLRRPMASAAAASPLAKASMPERRPGSLAARGPASLADLSPEQALARAKKRKDQAARETKDSDRKLWISVITVGVLLLFSPFRTMLTCLVYLVLGFTFGVRMLFIKVLPGADTLGDYFMQRLLAYFWGWYALFWLLWLLMGAALRPA